MRIQEIRTSKSYLHFETHANLLMKRNFTHFELLQNSDFIHWVKTGEERSFSWSEWIKLDPENEKNSQIARSIILSIECDEDSDPSETLKSLWDNIDDAIDP